MTFLNFTGSASATEPQGQGHVVTLNAHRHAAHALMLADVTQRWQKLTQTSTWTLVSTKTALQLFTRCDDLGEKVVLISVFWQMQVVQRVASFSLLLPLIFLFYFYTIFLHNNNGVHKELFLRESFHLLPFFIESISIHHQQKHRANT